MGVEIERKFLICSDAWRKDVVSAVSMMQGYLCEGGTTVRVRIEGDKAFLTIKGKAVGIVRPEYQYPLPLEDARQMLDSLCVGSIVNKTRYCVPAANGLMWEIDEYHGENAPLFTAEIELPDAETVFDVPQWLGEDVSLDRRYSNRALSINPYSKWDAE